MRPVDAAVACRRLLAGEDPEAVLAGAHGPVRSALVRGVVALLRPVPGHAAGDPEIMLRALVRRAALRAREDALHAQRDLERDRTRDLVLDTDDAVEAAAVRISRSP